MILPRQGEKETKSPESSAASGFPLSAFSSQLSVLRVASFAPLRAVSLSEQEATHVALRAAWPQCWLAFQPEKCLALRSVYSAYRAAALLLGSRPAPAGTCSGLRSQVSTSSPATSYSAPVTAAQQLPAHVALRAACGMRSVQLPLARVQVSGLQFSS